MSSYIPGVFERAAFMLWGQDREEEKRRYCIFIQ